MKKPWFIALNDTLMRFRDRNGILLMLAAPLVLAAITGAAFGGLSGSGSSASPITGIPVILVNADEGELGQRVIDAFAAAELADLVAPVEMADLDAARRQVEEGATRAVVYIPAAFSAAGQGPDATAVIEVLTDPTAAFSPLIIRSITEQIANNFNAGIIGGQVAAAQALQRQQILGPALAQLPQIIPETIAAEIGGPGARGSQLRSRSLEETGESGGNFNALAYFAPSMAILFLMFTIFEASRALLDEEREWTLPRLMSTPTPFRQILAGKIGGVVITGVLQLSILILVSALIFRVQWGSSWPALALMVLGTVAAAASLGIFITAIARDAGQAGVIGSATALIFAILGGNFVVAAAYPAWLQPLSKLTINRWALDGLTDLSLRGGGFGDVVLEISVLFGMAAIFFLIAVWRLPRRFVR
ncbi:MAG TPA: hypothetical protein DEP84_00220 [Chloroflexi bacterium]|nr:hypothetical protein [Chloroflexota bacterium]